jgi:hypothetical protein
MKTRMNPSTILDGYNHLWSSHFVVVIEALQYYCSIPAMLREVQYI